jgi:predicted ATPase
VSDTAKEGPKAAFVTAPSYRTIDCLNICVMEGILEHYRDDAYRWVHDKIHEAVLSLIDAHLLKSVQYRVGQVLVKHLPPEGIDPILFVTANLLNEGASTMRGDNPDREMLAALNLRAGVTATSYLAKGVDLLSRGHWTRQYGLSLELYSTAAEAEFCTGKFDRMKQLCDEILKLQDRPLLDKRRAYNVLLDSLGAQDHMLEALDMCLQVLSLLGCQFPKRALKLFVVAGFVRTEATMKRWTPAKVSELPPMTDATKIWAMTLLDKLVTYAYLEESDLLPLAILKSLRWTIRYGVCELSPATYALVGLSLAAHLGDFHGGKIYAQHALTLVESSKVKSRKVQSRTLFVTQAFVLHWTVPVQITKKPLLNGYQVGMAMGDTESAMWCIYFYLENSMHTGGSLESLAADLRVYSNQMKEFKQLKQLSSTLLLWQAILNLMGESENTYVLTGDAMDESEVAMQAQTNIHLFGALRRMQLYIAFYFGEYERVMELIRDTGINYFEKVMPGIFGLCPLAFMNGIASFAMAAKTGQRKYRKLGLKFTRKVKGWIEKEVCRVFQCDLLLLRMYLSHNFCVAESQCYPL